MTLSPLCRRWLAQNISLHNVWSERQVDSFVIVQGLCWAAPFSKVLTIVLLATVWRNYLPHDQSHLMSPYGHKQSISNPSCLACEVSPYIISTLISPHHYKCHQTMTRWQGLTVQLLPTSFPGCLRNDYLLLVQSHSLVINCIQLSTQMRHTAW